MALNDRGRSILQRAGRHALMFIRPYQMWYDKTWEATTVVRRHTHAARISSCPWQRSVTRTSIGETSSHLRLQNVAVQPAFLPQTRASSSTLWSLFQHLLSPHDSLSMWVVFHYCCWQTFLSLDNQNGWPSIDEQLILVNSLTTANIVTIVVNEKSYQAGILLCYPVHKIWTT